MFVVIGKVLWGYSNGKQMIYNAKNQQEDDERATL